MTARRCVAAQDEMYGSSHAPCMQPVPHAATSTAINTFFQVKNVKHTGNITMDDVISIARIMAPRCEQAARAKGLQHEAQAAEQTEDHSSRKGVTERE